MNLTDYQQSIKQFVRYAPTNERPYLALGLVAEVGEVSGKFAKRMRGDAVPDADLIAELGDVLWYISAMCREIGVPLAVVANTNIKKLKHRKKYGKSI